MNVSLKEAPCRGEQCLNIYDNCISCRFSSLLAGSPTLIFFAAHMHRHDRGKPLKAASMPQLGDKYIFAHFSFAGSRRQCSSIGRAFACHTFRHSTSVLKLTAQQSTHFEPRGTCRGFNKINNDSLTYTLAHTHPMQYATV